MASGTARLRTVTAAQGPGFSTLMTSELGHVKGTANEPVQFSEKGNLT